MCVIILDKPHPFYLIESGVCFHMFLMWILRFFKQKLKALLLFRSLLNQKIDMWMLSLIHGIYVKEKKGKCWEKIFMRGNFMIEKCRGAAGKPSSSMVCEQSLTGRHMLPINVNTQLARTPPGKLPWKTWQLPESLWMEGWWKEHPEKPTKLGLLSQWVDSHD